MRMPTYGLRNTRNYRRGLGSVASNLLHGSMSSGAQIVAGQTYTIVGSAVAFTPFLADSALQTALNTQYTQALNAGSDSVTGVFGIVVQIITPPGSGTVEDLLALADQQISQISSLDVIDYLEVAGVFQGQIDPTDISFALGITANAVGQEAGDIAQSLVSGVTSGIGAGLAPKSTSSWIAYALLAAVAIVVGKEFI